MEQLVSVRSVMNNTMLDFTIVELTTNKSKYNITLRYKPELTQNQGITYRYIDNLYKYCKEHNINTDMYDFTDNKDTLKQNIHNPLEIFNLVVYNVI